MISLSDRYRGKIKTAEELALLVGSRPRSKSVIMCHGVFDIVHPGHLRHLIYAKSKADVLIASLTADKYVVKGPYRPHVAQDLRAINLAAYEMVDYVLIDKNETPLENIGLIRPDLFAKGFEYGGGPRCATTSEQEVLTSYGGELIFTPGDVIYSSSRLIAQHEPDLALTSLQSLMESNDLNFAALRHGLRGLAGHHVHVLGDTIVDTHTYCTAIGNNAKTPTLSAAFLSSTHYVGGAGVVAKHLRAAGAEVVLSTVLGGDELGKFVVADLKNAGVKCSPVVDTTRPTTQKNTFIVDGYRLLKVDTVDNTSISDSAAERLMESIYEQPDALIYSDFRHGIFNKRTIPRLTSVGYTLRVADSQVASRWGNITDFKGFDLITPNEREARFALGDQDSGVRPLAARLRIEANADLVFLKLGSRGLLACRGDSYFVVPSLAREVVDPVGAGDALLAYSTLSLLAHSSDAIAAIFGSIAAACVCAKNGNEPVTLQDMESALTFLEKKMESM
jgi:rfaE bifunctional protein kinase chain/domain